MKEQHKTEKILKMHWSDFEEEGGSLWHFRVLLWMARHLPLFLVEICTSVICFIFWMSSASLRTRSRIYLDHLCRASGVHLKWYGTYLHLFSFGLSLMERLRGWNGAIKLSQIETQEDDLPMLVNQLNHGKGAFILCSHMGNVDMLRSLAGYHECHAEKKFQVYSVMNISVVRKFMDLLSELKPDLMEYVIDSNSIGVDTAIFMKEKIEEGNLVVIAGDRTSANSRSRKIETYFLDEKANFPEGAFLLASILNATVYFVFAIRKKDFNIRSSYEMHVVRAKTSLDCPRKQRYERLKMLLQEYTDILETLCKKHPFQWYNFYNFWGK